MVLAKTEYIDVSDDDHLLVVLSEDSLSDDLWGLGEHPRGMSQISENDSFVGTFCHSATPTRSPDSFSS